MSVRQVPAAVAVGLALLALGGCASHSGGAPQPDKLKASIQSLGGTPETIYQEQVLSKDLTSGHYTSQMVFLVPSNVTKGFEIVDSGGEIYRNFDDFLRNNRWPE